MSSEPESDSVFTEHLLDYPNNNAKEELDITRAELDQLKGAMKDPTFRKLLNDYVDEVRDPTNQLTYQTEMRQLERERGNIVHFINPVPGFVLKTSVDGKKKAFINVCSNPLIKKPSFETVKRDNKMGSLCSIPYSQSTGREDMDKAGKSCTVYDVIFNPETLRLGKQNKVLQQKLEQTAIEAVETSFRVVLDKINVRKPNLRYKGMKIASTIKYKIGGSPPDSIDTSQLEKELPPQADEVQKPKKKVGSEASKGKESPKDIKIANANTAKADASNSDSPTISESGDTLNNRSGLNKNEEHTVPNYTLKYRSFVDMQDYCIENQREGRSHKPIPDELILTIDLPLLKNSSNLNADVIEGGWYFELCSDKKALYKLKLKLPFQVHQDASKATFDKDKRKLSITMKTIPKKPEYVFPDPELQFGEQPEPEPLEDILEQPIGSGSIDSVDNLMIDNLALSDSPPDSSCNPGSLNSKKSVSFSDIVQKKLYRSNSSILGQKKKNQRKAKNKKKARERLNSGESVSSMDDEDGNNGVRVRARISSGGSVSSTNSMDDEENELDGSEGEEEQEH